jgi:co-chaperonin GroES (HSP10)
MQMNNETGLHPLGVAVLVEPDESKVKNSIIALPDTVKDRFAMVEAKCRVIEVGPEAWKDERQPRAKSGDKVLVTKYAGYAAQSPKDGKLYRLVNDRDVFCATED